MCVVLIAAADDIEKRPPGVYSNGHELVFAGDEPEPAVVARLTRPREGQTPLVIQCFAGVIEPPPDEPG